MSDQQWWRSAVIYQVYIRSFADSNGDGDGDLAGLHSRLPYLKTLGVDALWVTPFYPSPMADGGYDVTDYRDVDPRFGSLADFDAMLADAHRIGLRVIVDIVPNHSSTAHRWFVEALAAAPGAPARDRYLFRDAGTAGDGIASDGGEGPPNDWESVFGGPAWTQVPDGQYYLHLFDTAQPDFNWRNPEVRAEFEGVLRFWLDRGVDGFRIDVAHGMIKAPGLPSVGDSSRAELFGTATLPYFDQDEVHEIYRSWRKILDSYPGERIAVAEAWVSPPARLARYVTPDELHQAFNFNLLQAPWVAADLRHAIDESLAATELVGAPTSWVLSNHDTHRHRTRYGSLDRARAAALLILALPGSAYLYQGEELGLPEVLDLPDAARQDPVFFRSHGSTPGRDGSRVPLPWSGDEPPFGFSETGASWLPAPADWAGLTVQKQVAEADSTLLLYRRALALRHAVTGALEWLPAEPDVLHFQRGSGLRCLVNLGTRPITPPAGYGQPTLTSGPLDEHGALPPDTAAWF